MTSPFMNTYEIYATSETTVSVDTKLWQNGPWVVPFNGYVWHPENSTAVTKSRP